VSANPDPRKDPKWVDEQLRKSEMAMLAFASNDYGFGTGEFIPPVRLDDPNITTYPEDQYVLAATTNAIVSSIPEMASNLDDLPSFDDSSYFDALEVDNLEPDLAEISPPQIPDPAPVLTDKDKQNLQPPAPTGLSPPKQRERPRNPPDLTPKVRVETPRTGRIGDGKPDSTVPNMYGEEVQRSEQTHQQLGLVETAQNASDALNKNGEAILAILTNLYVTQEEIRERLNQLVDKSDSEDEEDSY